MVDELFVRQKTTVKVILTAVDFDINNPTAADM